MRKTTELYETYRIKIGVLASSASAGRNGAFLVPFLPAHEKHGRRRKVILLNVVASDGGGWDHVSVTLFKPGRKPGDSETPTWEMMQFVKTLFWGDEETVVQFHPAASQYVNRHPGCLHLWKREGVSYITPPVWMVG